MNAAVEWLRDLVWPRTCAICGRVADRPARYICSDCLMRLPMQPSNGLCRKCGREAAALDGEFLCEDCRVHKPPFDRAGSAFRFQGDARELINRFKFREHLYLRDDLVDALEGMVRTRFQCDAVDCIVPMPTTLVHRFGRGYNQCDYLANALARRLALPCRTLLRRIGSPRRQGTLTEDDRRKNVIGTFAVTRAFAARPKPPACVMIVDDIMTTGSTLSEAARTLKRAGVKRVFAATLARSARY